MLKTEELKLVSEWDKTFPQSEKVVSGQCPAIAVSGPFGAVKEQCSGLYAQTMAEIGY